MKILVTGGTGFVGRYLSSYFLRRGHAVVAVGTSGVHPLAGHANFTCLAADTTQPGPWQEQVAEAEVVVNLAGRTIFQRWSKAHKQLIWESRVRTTRHLVEALPRGEKITVLSASGIGYYGHRGDDLLTEDAAAGSDFLAQVSARWEAEAQRAASAGHRVVRMRLGAVLGTQGGALAQMVPVYRLFAGGPLGSGRQWFPWIHIDDLAAAVVFIMARADLEGPFNFCAPGTVTNRTLAKALGRVLQRPAILKTPALALRVFMGEMSGLLLNSQRANPGRLLDAGFEFRHPQIDEALRDLLVGS